MRQWTTHPGTNYYFCTTSITKWYPLFIKEEFCDIIIDSLNYCRLHKGLKLHAYVIMPNHLHMIVSCGASNCLSDIMRDLKRFTSQRCTSILRSQGDRKSLEIFQKAARGVQDKQNYKVWQNGFHPIGIYTESFLIQKMDYLHDNPVRKAYVTKAEEWTYSSARNYAGLPDCKISIDPF